MHISTNSLATAFLLWFSATVAVSAPVGLTIAGPIAPGTAISLTGDIGASLSIYMLKPGNTCDDAGSFDLSNPVSIQPSKGGSVTTVSLTGVSQTLTLSLPLTAGQTVCLVATKSGFQARYVSAAVSAPAASLGFVSPPIGDATAVTIFAATGSSVGVLQLPAAYTPDPPSSECSSLDDSSGQWLLIGPTGAGMTHVPVTGANQTLPLINALQAGTKVCLKSVGPAPAPTAYSALVTVGASPSTTAQVDFTGPVASSDPSILINGTDGQTISVYQFDSSTTGGCAAALKSHTGTLLPLAGSGSNATTVDSIPLVGPPPYNLVIATGSQLEPGGKLCLEQTDQNGGSVQYSASMAVIADSNNPYSRVRTFYTAGAMINNQNGSTNASSSSTGAEYLDIGLAFHLANGNTKLRPGVNSSISGRFSDISVAAPSTPASGTVAPAASNGTLNILSSQESFRVLGAVALPMRLSGKDSGFHFFTAPLVKAGFDTLLNPSATTTTASSGATAVATFAPVYWEYSSGLRLGYRSYPDVSSSSGGDPTPQTVTQMDITIGKFSNLQSIVCKPGLSSGASSTLPTNTICFTPVTSGTTTTYTLDQSRTNAYRIEVSGYFKFPRSPYVLGIDANLSQSAVAPKTLDVLNKTGGSVAIYFGISGSLTNLFKNNAKFP